MIENIHPVIVNCNDKRRRIMNIAFERDGSIYFLFPRKDGFVVRNASSNYYSNKQLQTNTIEKLDSEYSVPKISFHPANYTIHVKSGRGEYILEDYKLHNFSDEDDIFVCPAFQIVFPKYMDIFDEYAKTKYAHCLELDGDKLSDSLSLYIFIHSQNVIIPANALDSMIQHRDRRKKVLYSVKIASNAEYTCSLIVIDGKFHKTKSADDQSILVLLNTENQIVVYRFDVE